jgi:hypothetical protein
MRTVSVGVWALVAGLKVVGSAGAQTCDPDWSALGSGVGSVAFAVLAMDLDGDGVEEVYVGGQFTTAGGMPASRIARWNGSSWSALGSGVNNSVWALAAFDEDGDGPGRPVLIAGGSFKLAGGVTVNNVARWDGSSWSALGAGMGGPSSDVFALGVADLDGDGPGAPVLHAGGYFTQAGGAGANRVACWDGQAWSPLGSGISGGFDPFVSAFACFDEDGDGPQPPALFVAGEFANAGGVTVSNVARWNGASWSDVGGGTSGFVDALLVFDEDGDGPKRTSLFAAGSFSQAGGQTVNGVARWNATSWSSLGSGVSSPAFALAAFDPDGSGPESAALYAGGDFLNAGGMTVNHVARWDGAAWSGLEGGTSGDVFALGTWTAPDGRPTLIVAGGFSSAGSVFASNIAAWTGCDVEACLADCNGDGVVNIFDFLCFQGLVTTGNPAADCNGDGSVNIFDFLCFQGAVTQGCP